MRGKIDEMVDYVETVAGNAASETSKSVDEAFNVVIILSGVFVFVFIAISTLFPKMITSPMRDMINRINELAGGGGDLTKKINIKS